jgi:hypothetical protein
MRRLNPDVIRGVVLVCAFASVSASRVWPDIGVHIAVLRAQGTSVDPVLRGFVVDATTGVPLRRARLSAGSETLVFTDDLGQFTLATTPVGRGPLRVTKAGYVAAIIPSGGVGSASDVRIPLVRGAAINGRVVDRYGHAAEDTFVTAVMMAPPGDRTPAASRQFFTQVDALGDYRLAGLPSGRFQVRAMKRRPGNIPVNLSREEMLFGNGSYVDAGSDPVEMALQPGDEIHDVLFRPPGTTASCGPNENLRPGPGVVRGAIRGRVVDAGGEPIACASITVASATASVPPGESDEQGYYTIDGVPAGTFSLQATAAGFVFPVDRSVSITLRAGEERERVDFVLSRLGIITGTVVDEHGEPLEGIRMFAFNTRRFGLRYLVPPSYPGEPITDDQGRYRLLGLQPGRYLVGGCEW